MLLLVKFAMTSSGNENDDKKNDDGLNNDIDAIFPLLIGEKFSYPLLL